MIMNYLDLPSLLMILILAIPMLWASGLLRDFGRAFAIAVSTKREYTVVEMKRALLAMEMAIKIVWYTSIFWTIVTFIMVLFRLDTPETLGPNVAVALILLLYAALINIILLVFRVKVQVRLIDKEQ